MTRLRTLGYIATIISLTLGLLSLNGGGSQAATLLSITETPSPTLTDTPQATDANTPTPGTPAPISTLTPTATPQTDTPAPIGTLTATLPVTPADDEPSDTTPMGTFTLPQAGQSNPLPVSLLLVVAGGLLALWAWLLKQSNRHS